jgi:ABC-type sulfate/molybdate transport systems ATPase subunit
MLELRDVTRSLGRDPILARTSLDFPTDTPTAVLGLGASQRDLFLKLLAGAEKPQTGSVRLNGKDIAQARREKGGIMRIGPSGEKVSGQRVGKLIGQDAASHVRLAGKLDAKVAELDLDQRLRLSIAIARSGKPALILLDAPSAELDSEIRTRFIADLKPMLAETGAVVVLTAGSADEAHGLGGRVVVLDQGRVLQVGPAEEVFAHPANLRAALATSHPALNTLAMTERDGLGVLSDGSTFHPPEGIHLPGGPCTLAFRPDDTSLERQGAGCLRFVVRAAGEESLGGRRFVRVTFANASWLSPQLTTSPPQGMMLNAFVDRARLMVFDGEGKAVG